MAWTELTTDEVLEEFNARELASLNAIKGDDALSGIRDRVVARVRDAIMSGNYDLSTDVTQIPAGLHESAVAMIRWRFLISVAKNEALQTQDRRDANKKAEDLLLAISRMDYSVEPPTGYAGGNSRAGSWNSENKLVPRTHPVPRPGKQYQQQSGDYANPDAPDDQT